MLDQLQADIMRCVSAAWPEIAMPPGPRQFFTEIQAYRSNFVEDAARAASDPPQTRRLPPPYAVLQFGTERPDYTYGVGGGAIRVPVTVFYIARSSATQGQIRAKLERLRVLVDSDGATYQSIEFGQIDTSADSPVNAALIEAGTAFTAGHVRWDPGLLVRSE